jgi:ADP-heptose:LPS heptosyltransferase
MLNARMNAGFFKPGQYCPDEKHFLPYPENEPEIRRYVRLLEFLGVPSAGEALEFPLWKNDRQELSIMPETRDLWPRGYVCIHPGAHDPSRCWPAERFALVADALSDFDLRVVLTGSAGERGLTRRVAKAMRRPSIDLAGRTTIGALAVLLSNARLLVCNDTGISHIAAALHIPSVVVFTNSDPGRWAPLNISLHRAVAASNGSLASGGFSFRGGKGADGSQSLRRAAQEPIPGIEQVLTAAEDLLVKEKFYWQGE